MKTITLEWVEYELVPDYEIVKTVTTVKRESSYYGSFPTIESKKVLRWYLLKPLLITDEPNEN